MHPKSIPSFVFVIRFDNVPADGGGTSDTASYNPCTAFSQTTCTDAAVKIIIVA